MTARRRPIAKARKLLGALIVACGTLLLLQHAMGLNPEPPTDPEDAAVSRTHVVSPAPVRLISV